jgi:hypothetical protein
MLFISEGKSVCLSANAKLLESESLFRFLSFSLHILTAIYNSTCEGDSVRAVGKPYFVAFKLNSSCILLLQKMKSVAPMIEQIQNVSNKL